MHEPRERRLPHSDLILANCGIALSSNGAAFVGQVRYPPGVARSTSHQPFVMPALPAQLLDDCCRVLRAIWRRSRRCGGWLLYLDPVRLLWRAYLPPQWAGQEGPLLGPHFRGCRRPKSHLRLAGSFIAEDGDPDVPPCTSRCDGFHFRLHPGSYADIDAWATLGGRCYPVSLLDLISEPPLSADAERMLTKRLWHSQGS